MGVTSVRLTDELQDQLEQTAERLRRSKGWVISEALNEFMAKKNPAAAKRVSEQLIESIDRLRDQPELGLEDFWEFLAHCNKPANHCAHLENLAKITGSRLF